MTRLICLTSLLIFIALVASGCGSQQVNAMPVANEPSDPQVGEPRVTETSEPLTSASLEFSLQTGTVHGRMVYVGVGGDIDGLVNPDLFVQPGATVLVTLINGDGIPHDVSFPDFVAKSPLVSSKGKSTQVSFEVNENQAGTYPYFCTQAGHRQMGQEGKLIVGDP